MGALEGFRAKVLNRLFSANYGERFAHKREKNVKTQNSQFKSDATN